MSREEKKIGVSHDTQEILIERLGELKRKITLELFIEKNNPDPYSRFIQEFIQQLTNVTNKIDVQINGIKNERATRYNVTRVPSVLVDPERYHIRYTGGPLGNQGQSFINTLLLASQDRSKLTHQSKEYLEQLTEKRHIQVFVTLTCPYCPFEVINAHRVALERPDLISSECIDIFQNHDLARLFEVDSVPQTFINDTLIGIGIQQEQKFIKGVITLKHQLHHIEVSPPEEIPRDVDLLIVGGGPAGLTAGIYAVRCGLRTLILEKDIMGSQKAYKPVVTKVVGIEKNPLKNLIDILGIQARGYVEIREGIEVKGVNVTEKIIAVTTQGVYQAKSLLLATGAKYRKINVPGEEKFFGRGIGYSNLCHGYNYKNKNVLVVGGGNTALTDVIHLYNQGAMVTLIHRHNTLHGEKKLQNIVSKANISVVLNSVVEEIMGHDHVTAVKTRDLVKNTVHEIPIDGIINAIGKIPNSDLARDIGIEMYDMGFIKTDRYQRTNIPRIYATGEVTGGVRKVTTSLEEGATVAFSCLQDLTDYN